MEVAVRALAYGVNDPYPALTVVDWLSTAMVRLAGRKIPQPIRLDGEGRPGLIHTWPFTFSGVAEKSFNLIRQKARDDVAVRIRLLEAIADVAGVTRTAHDYDVLARQAEMIHSASVELIKVQPDLEDIEERYRGVLRSRPRFSVNELEQAG